MINQNKITVLIVLMLSAAAASSQTLTLRDAVRTALDNYGTIKAKSDYLRSSQASAKQAASEYLPNLSLAAQQAYGTANGQFGPTFAGGGLNAASSGPPFPSQNWNAAFGGLYLANVNWDFFAFGRAREGKRTIWNRRSFSSR
jgi:outer membrane protein TolC